MDRPNRLITFRISHFCEKARWALDRARIPYVEESHVPILSWIATFGSGARRTVPALITPGGAIPDSTDILRWVDAQGATPPLFAGEDVAALEADFDRRLGPATRRLAYFHILPERARTKQLVREAGQPWESQATRVLFPLIRQVIIRGLKIDDAGAERSRRALDATFAAVADRLADGRRWLCADRFTAADLSFAALAYPILWPDELVARGIVPPLATMPPAFVAEVERARATPAGRFGLRVYAEERTS